METSTAHESHRIRSYVLAATAAALVAFATLLAGGAAPALATTPAPPATDPPTTEPVTPTTPVTPVTTPDGPDEPTDDGVNWVLIGVVVGGLIVIVAIVAMLFNRKPAGSQAKPTRPAPAAPPSAQANLLSTSQWIHDQLTLELLAASPDVAMQRWSTERTRLDNVAIGAQQQYAEGHGELWQRLGETTSALATSIDTNLQVRSQDPTDPTVVQQSNDVVNRNRAALQQLVNALRSTT